MKLPPMAKEGVPFVALALALVAVAAMLGWPWLLGALVLLAFVVNFFRDPERSPEGEGFLAPADGKVVRAEPGRVDIFMNIFDVHVNRAPLAGRIVSMRYQPGRFLDARNPRASTENERLRIEFSSPSGRYAITLIAGLIARRIVPYRAIGDAVERGERIAMIRFGSRVDCELPEGWELKVRLGDRVQAGKSVLATPPSTTEERNG